MLHVLAAALQDAGMSRSPIRAASCPLPMTSSQPAPPRLLRCTQCTVQCAHYTPGQLSSKTILSAKTSSIHPPTRKTHERQTGSCSLESQPLPPWPVLSAGCPGDWQRRLCCGGGLHGRHRLSLRHWCHLAAVDTPWPPAVDDAPRRVWQRAFHCAVGAAGHRMLDKRRARQLATQTNSRPPPPCPTTSSAPMRDRTSGGGRGCGRTPTGRLRTSRRGRTSRVSRRRLWRELCGTVHTR